VPKLRSAGVTAVACMIREKIRHCVRLGNFGLVLATLTGLGVLVLLLIYNDTPAIFGLLASIGWGLLSIVLVRASIIVVAGLGWAKLVEPFASVPFHVYLNLRWIREAINVLLPVAQVGGDLIGGRLLSFRGVPGGLAGASILVDLLIQIIAQLAFTLLGFAALVWFGVDARLSRFVASGLAVSAVALLGFYVVQRSSMLRIAESAFIRFMQRWSLLTFNPVALHTNLQKLHREPQALLASFILHQIAWMLGVVEIWIALQCMGQDAGWGECLVLESLGQAVRSADFAVPGVMGVQEAGFLILGGFFGILSETCLALSLAKRVPDLILGLPGLMLWYRQERQRARAQGSPSDWMPPERTPGP
jgi:glycosyltransferase 2 family protein